MIKSLTAVALVLVMLAADLIIPGLSARQQSLTGTDQTSTPLSLCVEAASKEYRAFWFSYYDYEAYRRKYSKRNKSTFTSYFNKVCKNGKSLGMNRIIVQVRPFADAMYKSKYFPWSKCISGKQGRDPGYDPLAIMVNVAHKNGLAIEAWINPYRVASDSANYKRLSTDNIARKWHNTKGKKRNVLAYQGKLYFNPAKEEVRTLIVNGVKEIVRNYKVDGIHMDDYFYPSFSSGNVKTAFDGPEYKKSSYKKEGKSIVSFRRHQVNLLVKRIRSAVKSIRPSCTFGISPAGNIANLTSSYAYYVDIGTWMGSRSYIDYICPQIYWGFKHPTAKYDKVLKQWVSRAKSKKVKLYIGIAVYKAGHNIGASSSERKEWRSNTKILKNMVTYGRARGADGFAFFDYQDLVSSTSAKAVKQLKKVLK